MGLTCSNTSATAENVLIRNSRASTSPNEPRSKLNVVLKTSRAPVALGVNVGESEGDTVGFDVVGDDVGDNVGNDVVGDAVGLDVVGDVVGDDVGVDVTGCGTGAIVARVGCAVDGG